ncbi:MAG: hypothetical protein FJ096_14245, partial [Deltaproteobacteria bacterium]|nr:hypothetical protein [Deltaproteobacteria bacterium]
MLAHLCLSRGVHVGDAVSVLLRSLELMDPDEARAGRREVAAHLAALGRHDEASDLLREGGAEATDDDFEAGLAAADAAARNGDASGAAVIYRELALERLDDARALERLATIAAWSSASIGSERASDIWLEVSGRTRTPDAEHLAIARAFECAPGSRRATDALVERLARQHRHEAVDEILREHGSAAGTALEIAEERFLRARTARAWAAVVSAALDRVVHGGPRLDILETLSRLGPEVGFAHPTEPTEQATLGAIRAVLDALPIAEAQARADALLRVADSLRGPARATCLTLAAEAFLEGGNPTRARKAAMQARGCAPIAARPCTCLFEIALAEDVEMRELEDALGLLPPRAERYRTLARQCVRTGRHLLGGGWLRRALALRPGDPELRQRLLSTLAASTSTLPLDLVGATLVEVAAAPYPFEDIAPGLGRVLDALAERDAKRAAQIGRSLLQIAGPVEEIVHATVRAARASGEDACALDALVLHAMVGGTEHPERWLDAIDAALRIDVEAAAAHLSQAATLTLQPGDLQPRIDEATAGLSALVDGARSDARLDLAAARAWLAEVDGSPDLAAERWRDLGALRWDLARDPVGAEEAFFYACSRTRERGVARYVDDLLDRGGLEEALERIQARVMLLEEAGESMLAAAMLAATASVTLAHGRDELASELAFSALTRSATRLDALSVLEEVASRQLAAGQVNGALDALERAYRTAATTANGRHAARGLWHRGGRVMLALGDPRRALVCAVEAVVALPIEGATLRLARDCHRVLSDAQGVAEAEAFTARLLEGLRTAATVASRELRDPKRRRREERGLHLLTIAFSRAHAVAAQNDIRPSTPNHLNNVAPAPRGSFDDRRQVSTVQERQAREPAEPDLLARTDNATLTLEELELERAGQFEVLAKRLDDDDGDDDDVPSSRRHGLRVLRRLRRAAILARHLGDLEGACRDAERYLAEFDGVNVEAERQLARWYEQRSLGKEAAERWERVIGLAPDLDRKVQAAVRACEGFLELGDHERAAACLDRVGHLPPTAELTLLKLTLATPGALEEPAEAWAEEEFDLPTAETLRDFGIPDELRGPSAEELRAKAMAAAPSIGDSVDRDDISLLEEELDDGVYEAGELLAAIYADRPERFAANLLAVRRKQCRLRPGDGPSIERLLEALGRHGMPWEVEATRHVRQVLAGEPAEQPPSLDVLAESRDSVGRMIFGHLDGTINDALAVAFRGGVLRGPRRSETPTTALVAVVANSTTMLGRLHGSLSQLVPLEGSSLHHLLTDAPLTMRMSIRAPFGAVLEGRVDCDSLAVAYTVGSALAASTAPCAFAEGLNADDLDVLVRAFLAAFGPVPDHDGGAPRDALLAQLIQELWN